MPYTDNKPLIVVSATRYFQGGSIVIVDECLACLSKHLSEKYRIKALVYKKEIYTPREGVEFIEFPKSRRSAAFRLYHEYFLFKKLSKEWKPFLWLSMQDSTPDVIAEKRAVYFHNSLLWFPKPLQLLAKQPRLFFLWLLYKNVYTKGIRKNNHIVIQQKSFADFLQKKYGIQDNRLLIFPPPLSLYKAEPVTNKKAYVFIFPAAAMMYKNFEVLLRANKILEEKKLSYKIILTVSGTENTYIKKLKKKYHSANVEFSGFVDRRKLFDYYNQSDCMIFPSLLETWGLPLSEFALQHKPILCADLPYSKETLANYDKVKFFDPNDPERLAALMFQAKNNELAFDENMFQHKEPVIHSWKEMFDKILE